DRRNLAGLDVEIIEGDLLDRAAIERGVAGCRYAFHVAADYRIWLPIPVVMYRANVDGAELELRTAAKAGVERIVHCSSVAAVKVPHDKNPVDETSEYADLREIVGHYKKSKFQADVLARRIAAGEGLPIVVV